MDNENGLVYIKVGVTRDQRDHLVAVAGESLSLSRLVKGIIEDWMLHEAKLEKEIERVMRECEWKET